MMAERMLVRFWRDETGATAIEYGLLAGLVAVAAIAAFGALGGGLQNLFGTGSNSGAASTLEAAASRV